ncbi:YlaI family protein [Planococcus sp. SIMBA_160]
MESIPDDSPEAKKLRNRPIHTYMCNACNQRIEKRTNERIATGNFRLYRTIKNEDEW